MTVRGLAPSDLGPTLRTARLLLRPPCEADFEPFAAMYADEATARWIGGARPPALSWRALATMVGSWTMRGYGMFAVLEADTGRWLGQLGPWMPAGWPGPEIGWAFARDAWGRGYATEAATAAMDWSFDALGWEDVIHSIQSANTASIRLAERLGSVRLGPVASPPPYDQVEAVAWGQSREAWRARRAA